MLCAMVPLAFGIAGDCYVVLDKVLDSAGLALTLAGLSLVFCCERVLLACHAAGSNLTV